MWSEIANHERLLYPLAWVQIEECIWSTLSRNSKKEQSFSRSAINEVTFKIKALC